jgi:hypothetical protein
MPTTVPTFPARRGQRTAPSSLILNRVPIAIRSIWLSIALLTIVCSAEKNSLERDPLCERGDVRFHCGFSLGRLGSALQPRVLFGEGVDRLRAEPVKASQKTKV